jgi:hypothetical protein
VKAATQFLCWINPHQQQSITHHSRALTWAAWHRGGGGAGEVEARPSGLWSREISWMKAWRSDNDCGLFL